MLAVPLVLLVLAAGPAAVTDADVRPLWGDGPLASARQAFDAERWEEAARAFAASPEPEARYLRAVALIWSHRGEEATQALAGLGEALPAIADRVHYWTGQALDEAGRRREAAEAYERVPEGSFLWAEARLGRARALHALGDAAAAEAAVAPLLGGAAPPDLSRPDAAATALLLAGQIRAAGEGRAAAGEARKAFLACWARHPIAPESRECLSRLRSLPGAAGAPPGPEDALSRAEALLEANRNGAALQEVARVAGSLPAASAREPMGCRAAYVRGRAYRKERDYARAIQALRPVVERCSDPALRSRALYVLAGASANATPPDGVSWYLRLAREFPEHAYADDALFFAADLLVKEGKVEEARRTLSDLVTRYPKGDYRPEALFRLAWLSKRAGDQDAAIDAFARIAAEYQESDPYEHARGAYWRARLLAARSGPGDAEEARAAWAGIAARHPADYYGLLSRSRLAEAQGAPEPTGPPPAAVPEQDGFHFAPGPLADDPHFRAALQLLRMGLSRAAADELGAVDRRRADLSNGEAGAEPLLLLAVLLETAGDHRGAHNLLRTQGRVALRQAPSQSNLRVWRVAYPPAWRAEVQRWAPGAGVPVELLQAIMREESALDPLVVSPAGAVGLTQLMLPTAQDAARRLRIGRPTQADLTNAALNIRLGAVHLGDLLRRFGGSAPLAVAAYNAGETPVRAWWRARSALALDEFVEEIPLQETRGYVKRVLRSYAAYRLLYGAPTEDALRLGQALPAPR